VTGDETELKVLREAKPTQEDGGDGNTVESVEISPPLVWVSF
jgi:hypothetical protein